MKPKVKANPNKSLVEFIKQPVIKLLKRLTTKKKTTKPNPPVNDHNWWEFV